MCIVGGSMLQGSRDTLVPCSVVADLLTRERIVVQPSPQALTTRCMRNRKESLSHAPKASRRVIEISLFSHSTFMFIHSPFHLLTSLPRDLGYWRSFSILSISLMYSSRFTEVSRKKDGTRERRPRTGRSSPLNL